MDGAEKHAEERKLKGGQEEMMREKNEGQGVIKANTEVSFKE